MVQADLADRGGMTFAMRCLRHAAKIGGSSFHLSVLVNCFRLDIGLSQPFKNLGGRLSVDQWTDYDVSACAIEAFPAFSGLVFSGPASNRRQRT